MLNSLECQQHKKQVVKGCTKTDCLQECILLCEKCARDHSHGTDDIQDFLQIIGSSVIDTLSRQKMEWLKFCKDEQNKQHIQILLKKNYIEKFIQQEILNFSVPIYSINQNLLTKKRQEYIFKIEAKLKDIQNKEIENFKQQTEQYRQYLQKISQSYQSTFKGFVDLHQFQNPYTLQNKILSQDNPEQYLKDIKQLKNIDVKDLVKCVQNFNEQKVLNEIDFDQLLPVQFEKQAEKVQKQAENVEKHKVQDNSKAQDNSKCKMSLIKDSSWDGIADDPLNYQPINNVPGMLVQLGNPGSRNDDEKLTQYNSSQMIQGIPKEPIIKNIKHIKAVSLEQSKEHPLTKKKGVQFMICLNEKDIIYGTDTKLFQLRTNYNKEQDIPLQFDQISCLEKLDENSFIVCGKIKDKMELGKICKCQFEENSFKSSIILEVKADFLTIIRMSSDSVALIITNTLEKQITYKLVFCKYLGQEKQVVFEQNIFQERSKLKIKLYSISENELCLQSINKYIQKFQINEQKQKFELKESIECQVEGSIIHLKKGVFLFSTCNNNKIDNQIIDFSSNLQNITGNFVYQLKYEISNNIIAIAQITDQKILNIVLIDTNTPKDFNIFNPKENLDGKIKLRELPNKNILAQFFKEKLYISDSDENSDSIQVYEIKFQT